MKKKMKAYRDGNKSVRSDREVASPSILPEDTLDSPPYLSPDDSDPDLAPGVTTTDTPKVATMRSKAAPLPAIRDSGKRTPKDYQEAATVIREDKALYKQYKDGVASGGAFNLVVGGKTFSYAATPAKGSPTGSNKMSAYTKAVGTLQDSSNSFKSGGSQMGNQEAERKMSYGPTRAAKMLQDEEVAAREFDKAAAPVKKMKTKKG